MELRIVKFFNRLGRGTALDLLMRSVSYIPMLGIVWSLIALAIFFLDSQNGRQVFVAMVIAIGLHFIVTAGFLKICLERYFKRIRPYIAHSQEITPLGKLHRDSSFPSSHMSANLALLTVLVYFYPAILLVAVVWAVFTAFSRLHNGMHYPSDVLAGAILGVLYGVAGITYAQALVSLIF